MKRAVLGFCVAFLLGGCLAGTGTGNPFTNGAPNSGEATTAAESLTASVCRKLTACHGSLAPKVCYDAIMAHPNLTSKFGATPADFATMADARSGEDAGTLKPDWTFESECRSSLESLDCSSTAVQEAYQPSASDPWLKLPDLIPPVCNQVYPP